MNTLYYRASIMTFETFGLSEPILRAIKEQKYHTPTPIQAQAIPVVAKGLDVLAAAQTGTGKTASFVLPLLQQLTTTPPSTKSNQAQILILAPTRELAAQIHDSIIQYAQHLRIRSAVVFGGVKINPQMMKLRAGVDMLVATPGRLLDLYAQRAIRFDHLKTLVLDEADRMLDMGFIHDIKKIINLLPKKRQTLLFSATFSPEINQLAKSFLHNPIEISVTPPNAAAPTVKQWIHPVDKGKKTELLSWLLRTKNWTQALVFTRTKHGANKLVKLLAVEGIESSAIHGNKSQAQRTKALSEFKDGKLHVLVATDIAARGIDIDELPAVINFDLPQVAEDYVHRIGRTGRAGTTGCAVSLVSADEFNQLQSIERFIKRKLERVIVDDFYPEHQLPTARPSHTPSNYGAHSRKKPRAGGSNGNRARQAQATKGRK
jgi:ATP-dependent RNA helicase RhlE